MRQRVTLVFGDDVLGAAAAVQVRERESTSLQEEPLALLEKFILRSVNFSVGCDWLLMYMGDFDWLDQGKCKTSGGKGRENHSKKKHHEHHTTCNSRQGLLIM